MKGFKESETKSLIELVQKSENKDLTKVFKEYARISGRAQGSVRNYYYKTVKECKNNEELRKKLGVSKDMFPSFIKEFNDSESRELLKIVLSGVAKGKSVRSVISTLSNNNDKLALRYQNKYRNLIKNQKDLVLEVASQIKLKDGSSFNPYKLEEDSDYKKIENEIDSLIKRLVKSLTEENQTLLEKNASLQKENEKLREIFKKNMLDKNLTKDFFNKNHDINAI